jgi:flagellar biosynthesis/type III secretory pathway protein FliH
MEELLRLIKNFEYDRQKSGLLDDETRYFLEDVVKFAQEVKKFAEEEYERGKDEGYEEGKNDKDEEAIQEAIDELTKIEDIIADLKVNLSY